MKTLTISRWSFEVYDWVFDGYQDIIDSIIAAISLDDKWDCCITYLGGTLYLEFMKDYSNLFRLTFDIVRDRSNYVQVFEKKNGKSTYDNSVIIPDFENLMRVRLRKLDEFFESYRKDEI